MHTIGIKENKMYYATLWQYIVLCLTILSKIMRLNFYIATMIFENKKCWAHGTNFD